MSGYGVACKLIACSSNSTTLKFVAISIFMENNVLSIPSFLEYVYLRGKLEI
jgi:hypothetical protein